MITFGHIAESPVESKFPTLVGDKLYWNGTPKPLPSTWVVIDQDKVQAVSLADHRIRWSGPNRKWDQMNGGGWKLHLSPSKGKWWENDWGWTPIVDQVRFSDRVARIYVSGGIVRYQPGDIIGHLPPRYTFRDIYDVPYLVEGKRMIVPSEKIIILGSDRNINASTEEPIE